MERGLDLAKRSAPMSAVERDALATLRSVAELCQICFGGRFVAGYAMGSLARGGFSPLVSDVDFGLILSGPLSDADHRTIDEVQATAVQRQWTLADRLSIFWGSRESLRGEALGGRFPAFDRLDLLDHATLLAGEESRAGLPRPSLELLEVEGFEFALDDLATPTHIAEFHAPRDIISQGPLHLSKTVLYPPRFLFTSATGQVAGNDSATEYYLTRFEGPDADLVADTFRWRSRNEAPTDEAKTLALLEHGCCRCMQRSCAVTGTACRYTADRIWSLGRPSGRGCSDWRSTSPSPTRSSGLRFAHRFMLGYSLRKTVAPYRTVSSPLRPASRCIRSESMIGYVMLGTNDLARAANFYDALLDVIGATRQVEYESAIAWGVSADTPTLEITEPYDKNPATIGSGVMVALAMSGRAQVQAVHRKALELGGKDEGAPGPRDGSGFYGGYFRDLDGNKLAAFCME